MGYQFQVMTSRLLNAGDPPMLPVGVEGSLWGTMVQLLRLGFESSSSG
jgi:hypothetical protein